MALLEKEEETSLFIRRVPSELKRDFKAKCAAIGSDMTKEIIRFMESMIHETNSHDESKG